MPVNDPRLKDAQDLFERLKRIAGELEKENIELIIVEPINSTGGRDLDISRLTLAARVEF